MSIEVVQAYRWVVSTAKADTALMAVVSGVWQGPAPVGTAFPVVQVTQQSEVDTKNMQGVQIFARILLLIKAVGPSSSFDDLEIAANRIEALFGDARNISLSPGWVLSSYRESIVSYPENTPGVQIQKSHLGGLYRVTLQGS